MWRFHFLHSTSWQDWLQFVLQTADHNIFSQLLYIMHSPLQQRQEEKAFPKSCRLYFILYKMNVNVLRCLRFYDRQFITRGHVNKDILTRFESLLNTYYQSELPKTEGVPTVSYFAKELNLSANYFGDLVKKETGKTALEYIQEKVIDLSKERIFDPSKSISEIAFEMGYKYPQHFTRLFKQRVGMSPQEYRMAN